ncbi:unnamed protein product [Schistocephalus solidus]|uniref:Uncharacterized protein n=1 Tax=Schistocephalus solidus TaxID=70667 RepID=A0A183SBQ4_SCHSO|nr:unnamed protein product [Schistocephalus solidus]
MRNVIQSTALDIIGRTRFPNQEQFDDNNADINNLYAENNGLHKAYMDLRIDATKAAHFKCRRLVHQQIWEVREALMIQKAEEIQENADRNEIK